MACIIKDNTLKYFEKNDLLSAGRRIKEGKFNEVNDYVNYVNSLAITKHQFNKPLLEIKSAQTKIDKGSTFRRDNISSKQYVDVYNENFQELQDTIDEQSTDQIDYFEDDFDIPTTPAFDKAILLRKNLITRANNKLANIKREKEDNSTDTDLVKELTRLENETRLYLKGDDSLGIKGLEAELRDLTLNPVVSRIKMHGEADMERLSKIIRTGKPDDVAEARVIIDFYKQAGAFTSEQSNPFFEYNQMYDAEGNFMVDPEVASALKGFKEIAERYSSDLYQAEKKHIIEVINNNSKVRDTFNNELDYETVFHEKTGLKDAHWADKFISDVTNGIFSHNGIAPQVAMNLLQNSFETHAVYAKEIEQRMSEMQHAVEGELRKAGYSLKIPGLKGGVSYDLFRSKNKNGQYNDGMVQRYSQSFEDAKQEMLDQYNEDLIEAREIEDPVAKAQAYNRANTKRDNWYKKNTILIDPRKLNLVKNEFGDAFKEFYVEDTNHEAYLKQVLGEQGFQEEVAKQVKMIKDYQTNLEVQIDGVLVEEGVSTVEEISPEGKRKIEIWEKTHNPFSFSQNQYDGVPIKSGNLTLNLTRNYNYSIPRKNTLRLDNDTLEYVSTDQETGFYDKSFETIEANPVLKEFHNLLMDFNKRVFGAMPPHVRDKFNANSLPQLRRNLTEIFFDPNLSFYQRLIQTIQQWWDNVTGMFGINVQDTLSYATVNPITGVPDYQINAEFLKSNKTEIDQRFKIELLRLQQALLGDASTRLKKNESIEFSKLDQATIDVLAENLGVANTIEALKARLPGEGAAIQPYKILKEAITHQVIQEQSYDLPKMIKYFSHIAMEYQARQEAAPIIEMIKNHYSQIKKPVTNNIGKSIINADSESKPIRQNGYRTRAIDQMESWFNRAVLGDYSSKTVGALTDSQLKIATEIEVKLGTKKMKTSMTGRILSKEDKALEKKIKALKSDLESTLSGSTMGDIKQQEIQRILHNLEKELSQLGKRMTAAKITDAIFSFIRYMGLGWNLSSQITNFMEGQTANFISASSGLYFTPENIYRANSIIQGSFLKNSSFGKFQTDGAKKTRIMMDRYRILQDASNELQKASTKTTFSRFDNIGPFAPIKRVEYLNQGPLMISIMMDQQITGKDGTVSNVWDEMQPDGTLTDIFRTEENRLNWEEAQGQAYKDVASKIGKAIVNTHGDYDALRGTMAGESVLGKSIIMFKRWLPKQLYSRFAVEQADIETGLEHFKGTYRSHTKASGMMHGAIMGFGGFAMFGAGPLGIALGAVAGIAGASFGGTHSNMNFLKESAQVAKETFLTMIRMPLNSLTGKQFIRGTESGVNFETDLDLKNYRANITDMAINLFYTATLLAIKALLFDDDDEADSARRRAHNMLVNRAVQLSQQSSMYTNVVEMHETVMGNLPAVTLFENIIKFSGAVQDYLNGEDISLAGITSGESKLGNAASKLFLPGVFKPGLGFEASAKRQFFPTPFDDWFHGDETKAQKKIRIMKAKDRKKFVPSGISKEEEKEIEKELRKIYTKKRGETYLETLERIEAEGGMQEE